MAVRSGFFNDVNDDRVYDANDFAEYFATFIGNGVFPNPSNGLQVYANNNMTTVVKAGKGWINGYFVVNNSDFIIAHDRADGALKRIDRIVLRKSVADRDIQIVIKKGTFATNPVAPTVVRDADFYELVLADVLIGAGATQIIQGNVTDQRLNKSLCGIVHAVVDQVDTTTIFNQYQSWFNSYSVTKSNEFQVWQDSIQSAMEQWINLEQQDFLDWKASEKSAFVIWFESVRGILNEDVAGNLYNLIDDHKKAAMPHQFLDTTDNKIYKYGFKTNQAKDGLIFVYEEVL
ncbi:hypothetical protein [Lysinibacillus sp. NPDC093216]|uniref:hypothetical protein n=1 Tax=Lysinibacillus sp. NPDC093216 TaxID=3390576 RepID=UPI003CFD73B8